MEREWAERTRQLQAAATQLKPVDRLQDENPSPVTLEKPEPEDVPTAMESPIEDAPTTMFPILKLVMAKYYFDQGGSHHWEEAAAWPELKALYAAMSIMCDHKDDTNALADIRSDMPLFPLKQHTKELLSDHGLRSDRGAGLAFQREAIKWAERIIQDYGTPQTPEARS